MLGICTKLRANKNINKNKIKQIIIQNKNLNYRFISKNFSTTNKNYQKLQEELGFEEEEDKDLRYEDQLFFLEREINKLRKDQKEYGQDYATLDFPEYQQREMQTLKEIIKGFDYIEKEYFYLRLKHHLDHSCNSDLKKQNSFTLKRNIKIENDNSKLNPNYEILDNILLPLMPYLASDIFIGGGGGAVSSTSDTTNAKKEATKEEKKEEKPKEVF